MNNLSKENYVNNDDDFQRFCHINLDALNKYAPCNKMHAWGNQIPFFIKELQKAVKTRTKLRNIFLPNKNEENKVRGTKQMNFYVWFWRDLMEI